MSPESYIEKYLKISFETGEFWLFLPIIVKFVFWRSSFHNLHPSSPNKGVTPRVFPSPTPCLEENDTGVLQVVMRFVELWVRGPRSVHQWFSGNKTSVATPVSVETPNPTKKRIWLIISFAGYIFVSSNFIHKIVIWLSFHSKICKPRRTCRQLLFALANAAQRIHKRPSAFCGSTVITLVATWQWRWNHPHTLGRNMKKSWGLSLLILGWEILLETHWCENILMQGNCTNLGTLKNPEHTTASVKQRMTFSGVSCKWNENASIHSN